VGDVFEAIAWEVAGILAGRAAAAAEDRAEATQGGGDSQ
jgi:hypothetical protein